MTSPPVSRRRSYTAIALIALLASGSGSARAPETFQEHSQEMIDEIQHSYELTASATGRERISPRLLTALQAVPRHEFVRPGDETYAYENRPLYIGHGQTISQPYIVAIMTDLLDLQPTDRVLELGTGSGYQAAILSKLVAEVYSIEIVEPLGIAAGERLARLGHHNVEVRIGDGYLGWPEHAPFDAIIVTAAGEHVPQPLVHQLTPGGRMIIPVGPEGGTQNLLLIRKREDGRLTTQDILPVSFVPITGQH